MTRFTEGIELMKACWTEPKVSFHGRFFQAGAAMGPKTYQKPHPPIRSARLAASTTSSAACTAAPTWPSRARRTRSYAERAVIDAGADLVLIDPMTGEAGQLDRLAEDVLPELF
ncbi:hypothetical protein ABZW11_33295 [Nonomuraea sp. NPDC004580]|uniref:hypothetical protein n=1 Tax=Nonomuraea sp. NPDC004580 TaxID=3154552 RepID=UPI0033B82E4B